MVKRTTSRKIGDLLLVVMLHLKETSRSPSEAKLWCTQDVLSVKQPRKVLSDQQFDTFQSFTQPGRVGDRHENTFAWTSVIISHRNMYTFGILFLLLRQHKTYRLWVCSWLLMSFFDEAFSAATLYFIILLVQPPSPIETFLCLVDVRRTRDFVLYCVCCLKNNWQLNELLLQHWLLIFAVFCREILEGITHFTRNNIHLMASPASFLTWTSHARHLKVVMKVFRGIWSRKLHQVLELFPSTFKFQFQKLVLKQPVLWFSGSYLIRPQA